MYTFACIQKIVTWNIPVLGVLTWYTHEPGREVQETRLHVLLRT